MKGLEGVVAVENALVRLTHRRYLGGEPSVARLRSSSLVMGVAAGVEAIAVGENALVRLTAPRARHLPWRQSHWRYLQRARCQWGGPTVARSCKPMCLVVAENALALVQHLVGPW